MTPIHWRDYQRHPISSRYDNITGQDWMDFKDNLNKRKVRGRSICLAPDEDDGHILKVLDGWQLLRACLELDIEPTFTVLRAGEDPEAFVTQANDLRRHESAEMQEKRRERRRARVANARVNGQSIRTIAEDEGVSKSTVERDIEGVTVPGGTVTGKDDREQPASKPRKPKILCPSCLTRDRKSQPPEPKCRECRELRKTAKAEKAGGANLDADPVNEPKESPKDDLGTELPKRLRDAFAGNRKSLGDGVKLLQEVKRMCKNLVKWNPFLRGPELEAAMTKLVEDLKNGLPHAVCTDCHGKGDYKTNDCKICHNAGWVPKWAYKENSK